MKAVTITGKDRPELFTQTLQSLKSNDLTGWSFFVGIEPGPCAEEFRAICRDLLSGSDVNFHINDRVLGVRRNPLEVIGRAFAAGARQCLCIEEDLLLSPDVISLADWFIDNHRANWLCLNLLSGPCATPTYMSSPNHPGVLFESRTFNSLGFVIRREEWHYLENGVWMGVDGDDKLLGGVPGWRNNWGWDWSVYAFLASHPSLRSLQPALARAIHNGPVGTFCLPEFHAAAFGDLPLNNIQEIEYSHLSLQELPREIRVQVQSYEEMTDLRLALERQHVEAQRYLGPLARLVPWLG